ncbi:C39 family peptidase [Pendulispora albinea]|uniref:Peptidase C39-like domain-containing protein n=1 Tax=Pendulispora albinea TaxID=2741071 RepID=A0ABZ2M1N0_9BACT
MNSPRYACPRLAVALSKGNMQLASWCWAASGEMIMAALPGGYDPTQCEEANHALGRSDCCSNGNACNYPGWPDFHYYGYHADWTADGNILYWDTLLNQINHGYPVAFSWKWNGGGGHMMVAAGWEVVNGVGYVLEYDPWPVGQGTWAWITYGDYDGGGDRGYTHYRDYYNIWSMQ